MARCILQFARMESGLPLKDGLAGSEEDWLSRLRKELPGTREYVEILAKTMEGDVCTAYESEG